MVQSPSLQRHLISASLEEILRLHDLARDPEAGDFNAFKKRAMRNVINRCLHQHVFDTRLVVDLVNYLGLQILTVELFRPYHIAIVAKKNWFRTS